MSLSDIVQRGWEAVGARDLDTLVSDYNEDMLFVMPGQSDILTGRQAFRAALNNLDEILPPGFDITGLRHIEGKGEVISIVEWESHKVAASQFTVLFKFEDSLIYEERWFLDTEQWKAAF